MKDQILRGLFDDKIIKKLYNVEHSDTAKIIFVDLMHLLFFKRSVYVSKLRDDLLIVNVVA